MMTPQTESWLSCASGSYKPSARHRTKATAHEEHLPHFVEAAVKDEESCSTVCNVFEKKDAPIKCHVYLQSDLGLRSPAARRRATPPVGCGPPSPATTHLGGAVLGGGHDERVVGRHRQRVDVLVVRRHRRRHPHVRRLAGMCVRLRQRRLQVPHLEAQATNVNTFECGTHRV